MHHLVLKQLLSYGTKPSPSTHNYLAQDPWTTVLKKKKAFSHFGDSTGDWVKKREETIPSQCMPLRPRSSKDANMPPAASEPVGENEVASRQRGEVPLTE